MSPARMALVALVIAGGMSIVPAPVADATICGSVGGYRVNVSGCADPFAYVDSALPPPPPPPGAPPPPPPAYVPPPPAPNVSVCANVGRRINVTGCI